MKARRKDLKLMAFISVSVFSLAVLFMGTFAWFVAYRDKQMGSSSPFSVDSSASSFKKMYLYELDTELSTSSTYKFSDDEIGTIDSDGSYTGGPINFGLYTQSDRKHPVLLIIEFNEELQPDVNNPVKITASTESTFVADGEVDAEGKPVIKLHTDENPLSSIVEFKGFSYPKNDTGVTGISTHNATDGTFDYAVSSTDDSDAFVSFTTSTSGGYLEYDGFDNEKDLYKATTGSVNYVAIVLNYYGDALDYIYNYYLGTEALEEEYIDFKCDWTLLIV